MSLLSRFSTHVKDVLAKSFQLATQLNNAQVEPLHILFVMQNQRGSIGADILNRLKLDLKTLEKIILDLPVQKDVRPQKTGDTTTPTIVPISESCKLAMEKALAVAHTRKHNYIGTEHLLWGLIKINDAGINEALKQNKITVEDIEKDLDIALNVDSHFPQMNEVLEAMERIQENLSNMSANNILPPANNKNEKKTRKKESALDFFANNLNDLEQQKNIDPIIGRENEIDRLIQIICRRTKNNPVLLGDPGVGKTAIVEGLAKRIFERKVPDILLNKKIYALDMGLLIAGTIYRGEFEGRLRQVIEDVSQNPDIILFIDELHNIVGAGSNQGTMDAANILKPALARGQIRCIGSTTTAEFKKHIENDAALERRFQPIIVKEPTLADSVKILEGIKNNYEIFHNIKIEPSAIESAVALSNRYINNKFLPDKAIDLLDETAAAKRILQKNSTLTNKIERLRLKLDKITIAKEATALSDRFEEAVQYKKDEEKIRKEIETATAMAKTKKVKFLDSIDDKDVLNQLAKIIGAQPTELKIGTKDELKNLEKKLKEFVLGQDTVIKEVGEIINRAQLGLNNMERPLASFLFVGESGVGKTELAKTIAKILYPTNKDAFIKLDMSEFNESFGVSKLLGSPAGYIGYKESNGFTDRIKNNPHCVILFDEIDKAHKDVTKLLLQILENGEISDSTGKKISLKHGIIILTTSYGAELASKANFGFGGNENKQTESKKKIVEKAKEFFSPEIINRLDTVCLFSPLSRENLLKIAELEILQLNEQLEKFKTTINSDSEILEKYISTLPEKQTNARDIRRTVRGELEKCIAQIILQEKTKKQYHLFFQENNLALK